MPLKTEYYHPDGSLKWGSPFDVGHLILQLQTLDPSMKVSSVTFVDRGNGVTSPRAYGLSMSYERWGENGWLDFTLPGDKCLAIWATERREVNGLAPVAPEAPVLPEEEPDHGIDAELDPATITKLLDEGFSGVGGAASNEKAIARLRDAWEGQGITPSDVIWYTPHGVLTRDGIFDFNDDGKLVPVSIYEGVRRCDLIQKMIISGAARIAEATPESIGIVPGAARGSRSKRP